MSKVVTRRSSGIEFSARERRRETYRRTRVREGVDRLRRIDRAPTKRGRRKPKYSRGTKDVQRLAYGMTKGTGRVAKAIADGLNEFNNLSRKSRRDRRDGAVLDGAKNAADGIEKGLRELGRAPRHVAVRIPSKRLWKGSRRAVALLSAPMVGLFR